MEQFILGMLQEQLGKFIVGFRKDMVNASLLNGKGEITDISLNCAAINQMLSNIVPFVELDSVHISRVAFQVTSWTNLRKAPIMVDIEHITVHISEPLHYLFPKKRRRIRQMTVSEMEQHFANLQEECKRNKTPFNNPNKRGGYSLADRIADNLTIEIKSIFVQFQTWGKFKTRRPGPWTPPSIQFKLRNLRYCSVDEFGQEGTPEDHWAHNNKPQPRGQDRTLLIFKKTSMEYDFGVTTIEGKQYSLLKGGKGVQPEVVVPKKKAAAENKTDEVAPAPHSPTAEETVAALAGLGGPTVVETDLDPKTAAETLAALALGESERGVVEVTERGVVEETTDAEEQTSDAATKAVPTENGKEPDNGDSTPSGKKKEGDGEKDGEPASADKDKTEDPKSTVTPQEEEKEEEKKTEEPDDDCNNRVVVQMAMKRRIRDGALLAIQVDTSLSKVEVQIQAEAVPHLVHAAMGLQFCLVKDRGFEDPLRSEHDKSDHNDASARINQEKGEEQEGEEAIEVEFTKPVENGAINAEEKESDTKPNDAGEKSVADAEKTSDAAAKEDGEENSEATNSAEKPDDVLLRLPSIALDDNNSAAGDALSVPGEGTDVAENDTLEGSTVSQLQSVDENKTGFGTQISNFFSRKSIATPTAAGAGHAAATAGTQTKAPPTTPSAATPSAPSDKVDRAVIMLPDGLVIHEKISVSVTIDRATVRGVYAPSKTKPTDEESRNNGEEREEDADADKEKEREPDAWSNEHEDYIQLDSSGAVVELIWPKSNLEKGGYAQVSVSYASVQERYGKRIRTIVSGGFPHGGLGGAVEKPSEPPNEVPIEAAFPVFEDRAIREDPLQTRRTYPAQFMGILARIDCETRAKIPEKPNSDAPLPTTITTGAEAEDDGGSSAASIPNTSQDGSKVMSASHDESTGHDSPKVDNPDEVPTDDVVEVFVVNNDLGVDQMNVVLDFDSWCRTIRFLLNEQGGGFDGRWLSGDWTAQLTPEMLVHPNATLELDDHLQTMVLLYLDENEFVSSDLFHVNARIKNCEFRIPAAIEQNVRSCDIVALIDEAMVIVSSDLPRAFPSGHVGSTFSGDDNSSGGKSGAVRFPNDPSDVSIELEKGEDPSRRQSFIVTADTEKIIKTSKSTLRLQLKLRGMSTQIVPVIPFYTFLEPQQLMAPTDMSVGFAFEGEPPETEESNLVKMVFYSAVIVKQIQMNCDLELLAGATSTLLHHFHVVRETVKCAMELFPMAATSTEEESSVSICSDDELSSAASLARIQKSLRGRGILVHRQLHRSRQAGGLSFGVFLQVENYDFVLWRQNVSMYSPIEANGRVINTADRHKIHFPLLKLLSFSAQSIEVGIEISFPDDERRVVVKCGVSEARLRLCDLNGSATSASPDDEPLSAPEVQEEDPKTEVTPDTSSKEQDEADDSAEEVKEPSSDEDSRQVDATTNSGLNGKHLHMIDFFHFGREVPIDPTNVFIADKTSVKRDGRILIRGEERYGKCRSRSFAADVGTGGIVNLHIEQFEAVFLLVLEALMMPTWSKSMSFPLKEKKRFPEKSVGSLFHSLLLPGENQRFRILRLLWKLVRLALPQDLKLLLLHARMDEVLITIPQVESQETSDLMSQKCALVLRHLDLVTWYMSSLDDPFSKNLFPVVAKEGECWSSLMTPDIPGVNHIMDCKQSFYVGRIGDDAAPELQYVELLPEFEVSVQYVRGRLFNSIENTSSLDDPQLLRECAYFLWRFASRCVAMFFHLKQRLSVLKRPEANGDAEGPSPVKAANAPISVACADIEESVRIVRGLLRRMGAYLDESAISHDVALRRRDAQVERLQKLVFVKEKERLAAIAMASSPIAGWLRVGGTHQIGQRVSSTSTLVRYWAVIRKDVLFFYSAPGKFKPTDLVSLRGAHLSALAGGKSKWDLKRSFGIIESTGKTRFFVVGSDDEYNAWIKEIKRVVHYQELFTEDKGSDVDENKETQNGDNESIPKIPSDRDEESVGVASTGPLATDSIQSDQGTVEGSSSSKLRGRLSGLGSFVKRSTQDQSSPKNDSEAGSQASLAAEETATTATTGSVTEEQQSGASKQTERGRAQGNSPTSAGSMFTPDGKSGSTSRRLVGKIAGVGQASASKIAGVGQASASKMAVVGQASAGKIAGVGQATGRWGSALMSATKKKTREVAERSRRAATPTKDELSSSGHNTTLPLHVISEREDEERNWTCPTCTFINTAKEGDADLLICAMCGSPAEASKVEFEEQTPEATAEAMPPSDSATNVDAGEDPSREHVGSADSGQDAFRRQSSEPVGFRERVNSADSDPDIFRRTQSAGNFANYVDDDETSIISDLAMDEMSEAARSTGGRRRSRLGGLLGSGRKARQPRPAETQSESKGWFSRLGSNVSNQDETDAFQKASPALKLKNIRLNPNIELVCDHPPAINLPLRKLDGPWYVLVTECENSQVSAAFNASQSVGGDSATSGLRAEQRTASDMSLLSTLQEAKEQYFRIEVIQKGLGDFKPPGENVIKSFSDIVGLHAVISECVVDLIHHPVFYEKSFERTNSGEMSSGLKNALGVSPLDSVRISGAFLAGLVDAMSTNPPLEIPPARHAEAAMEFLNSILVCPLSSTGHFALTEFLGITGAPSTEVLSAADLPPETVGEMEVLPAESEETLGKTSEEASEDVGQTEAMAEDFNLASAKQPDIAEAASGESEKVTDGVASVDIKAEEATSMQAVQKQLDNTQSQVRDTILNLSSQCMVELLQAEQNGKLATDMLNVATLAPPAESSNTAKQFPLLPNHVTENLQNAMHVALLTVMTERDEAHAQLVSASVLHAHALEQERKKTERLEVKLEVASKLAEKAMLGPGIRFGLNQQKIKEEEEERQKLLKKQMEMQQNSDSEIVALCEQLSGEISGRTKAALEVIRLKESRRIERKHETEEKDALRDELMRVKEMLAQEQKKAQDSQQDADRWKRFYERAKSDDGTNGEEN